MTNQMNTAKLTEEYFSIKKASNGEGRMKLFLSSLSPQALHYVSTLKNTKLSDDYDFNSSNEDDEDNEEQTVPNRDIQETNSNKDKFIRNKKGVILSNINNNSIAIAELYPNLKFSEIHQKIFLDGKPLTTADAEVATTKLVSYFHGRNIKHKETAEALRIVARRNVYNPLQEYFEKLPQATSNHLDNWLTTILGVSDTPINRTIGRKWLISAVARAIKPGSYVEGALILFGKQAAGKTLFFRTINPAEDYYFGDAIDIANTQKATQTIMGKFIVEFNELSSLSKASLEEIKSYLTRQEDTYVGKYENFQTQYKRVCVFGGSTNNRDILFDTTGNRRFWCVETSDNINIDLLKQIKEELWSEAYQAYTNGEEWILTDKERDLLDQSNELYMEDNPVADYIADYLENIETNTIKSTDLYAAVKSYDSKVHYKTIRKIMENKLGWKNKHTNKGAIYVKEII